MFKSLIEKLQNSTYITLETTPGHGPNIDSIINKISDLGIEDLVDGFSTTDNPLAKLKFNALFAALILQKEFDKPVIATMSMRDRNKIALQSDLLGANAHKIQTILALTGDSASISDQPNSKGVFEADSTLLLDIIKCFNAGIDYAGKPLANQPKPIYPFSVVNAYAKQDKTLIKKMSKKISHGSIGIITQPVYDVESAVKLLDMHAQAKQSIQESNHPNQLIFGIFPIMKLRTAQFLTAHVPGINVPKVWLDALYKASQISQEEEHKVGFEMSKELFESIKALHPKIHLMTANHFELAKSILV